MNIGNHVQFSRIWLYNTKQDTSRLSRAKGIITDLTPLGEHMLATIRWDIPYIPTLSLTCNLNRIRNS